MENLDYNDYDELAGIFGAAPALIRELEYMNDDGFVDSTGPEDRYNRMVRYVGSLIKGGDHQ